MDELNDEVKKWAFNMDDIGYTEPIISSIVEATRVTTVSPRALKQQYGRCGTR
jgi:hypothetical protein